ncbi:hypothetical protein PFISCL1PPCAC_11505, partial [Pristionchus fissidentatus]
FGGKRQLGFLAEVWKSIGVDAVYEQYPYGEEQSDTVCDGMLKAVQEGEVLASAGANSPSSLRAQHFRLSTPAYYTYMDFYESARAHHQDTTQLVFFTVFSIPSLLILIGLQITATVVEFLTKILKK